MTTPNDAADARERPPVHPPSCAPRLGERVSHEAEGVTLVVPLGATEQHGPHLPLDTDTVIATRVAEALVARLREAGTDALLAPAIAFGSSGEHAGFAGTASIGAEALFTVLIELARSVSAWAARTIIVNGHGGNVPVLRRAEAIWAGESRRFTWCACVPPTRTAAGEPVVADLHAGRIETSLMLHLAPERVRTDRLEAGETRPAGEVLPELMRGGVAAVSPNGVLGDPRGASADEGAWLFSGMVEGVVAQCAPQLGRSAPLSCAADDSASPDLTPPGSHS